MAPGYGHFLHHERVYSHSACDRSCLRLSQNYSRTKSALIQGKSNPEFSANVNFNVSIMCQYGIEAENFHKTM